MINIAEHASSPKTYCDVRMTQPLLLQCDYTHGFTTSLVLELLQEWQLLLYLNKHFTAGTSVVIFLLLPPNHKSAY